MPSRLFILFTFWLIRRTSEQHSGEIWCGFCFMLVSNKTRSKANRSWTRRKIFRTFWEVSFVLFGLTADFSEFAENYSPFFFFSNNKNVFRKNILSVERNFFRRKRIFPKKEKFLRIKEKSVQNCRLEKFV